MPETTRSRVLAKVYGQSLDLRSAAAQLGLSVADLNEEFGVRPLDAERSLYAVLVCREVCPPGRSPIRKSHRSDHPGREPKDSGICPGRSDRLPRRRRRR